MQLRLRVEHHRLRRSAEQGRSCRRKTGQTLTELSVGCLILVPVTLFLLDITTVVLGNSANDDLVKRAARAAGQQQNIEAAKATVKQIKDGLPEGGIVKKVDLLDVVQFDAAGNDGVKVRSEITVALPVPIPFAGDKGRDVKFTAEASEPITALTAAAE